MQIGQTFQLVSKSNTHNIILAISDLVRERALHEISFSNDFHIHIVLAQLWGMFNGNDKVLYI